MFRAALLRKVSVLGQKVRYIAESSSNDNKASRMARRKILEDAQKAGKNGNKIPYIPIAAGVTVAVGGYVLYDIYFEIGMFSDMYKGSYLESVIKDSLWDPFGEVFLPSKDKLIPDWPTDPMYAGASGPAPPLLVIDVEKTLIGSEHDAKHGWRFVKRPGADKFIDSLVNGYYEVALFSERDFGMVEPVLMALDPPPHKCHHLYATHAEYTKKNKLLKRLDMMNRDIRRIILIDDDPDAFEGFERNTILVKPFEDLRDRSDSELMDLVPLLQGLIHHDSKDFRVSLDDLGTHQAEDIVVEYQMRVAQAKEEEKRKRNYGLGGIIRNKFKADPIDEDPLVRSSIPSPSALVGRQASSSVSSTGGVVSLDKKEPPGPVVKKKGTFFEYLDKLERDKEEYERIKFEKMNEIAARRMKEKEKQQEAGRRAQNNNLA